MNNVSTVWIIIAAGAFAVGLAIVANSDLAGLTQAIVMTVLGLAVLVCFALLVIKAAGSSDR